MKGHVRLKLYLKFRKEIGGLGCYFNEITGPMGFDRTSYCCSVRRLLPIFSKPLYTLRMSFLSAG